MTSLLVMSQGGGGGRGGVANLGQPANHLAVAPADGLGQEAVEAASVSEQLWPEERRVD